ncbi:alpha/beta fold hydrolase [Pedobacter sp. V48]|uniref:alpha/beta fold hydrolase n=1 Tax=Pedobacter sp. V48 TaxID=509635 RepID=UPI0006646930|nr:alpha/beta hydrolase [Pedobacter sp. V48]
MKNLKQIIEDIKVQSHDPELLQATLWKFICYSPKMPSRLHQQDLLNAAKTSTLKVYDQYFSKSDLNFNCFRWGNGSIKVLLTHGWGSKAIDFSELIDVLLLNKDIEIWAFDAPGNGSSEGELSNLILFAEAIKEFQKNYGAPDVMIGHSLGGMANTLVLQETLQFPKLLISIAPLVNLTENFKSSMTAVSIPENVQQRFFSEFEELYQMSTSRFLLNDMYTFSDEVKHLLIYEVNDYISPAGFIETFLEQYPTINASRYDDTTHAKIIIDPRVIKEINALIKETF